MAAATAGASRSSRYFDNDLEQQPAPDDRELLEAAAAALKVREGRTRKAGFGR
jgi:hypothetical protein